MIRYSQAGQTERSAGDELSAEREANGFGADQGGCEEGGARE